ncbi:MAG: 2-deoxy-5-keto-D-gluconate 6-phosphate aldolase domain-containing protein, partial [Rickettsiales bacterium]
ALTTTAVTPWCIAKSFAAMGNAPLLKGFAIGRTIFGEPAKQWFNNTLSDDACVEAIAKNYLEIATAWKQGREQWQKQSA